MPRTPYVDISEDLQQPLLDEPESGMGYQIVEVADTGTFLVLNATIGVKIGADKSRGGSTDEAVGAAVAAEVPGYFVKPRVVFEELPDTGQIQNLHLPEEDDGLSVKTHGSYLSSRRILQCSPRKRQDHVS